MTKRFKKSKTKVGAAFMASLGLFSRLLNPKGRAGKGRTMPDILGNILGKHEAKLMAARISINKLSKAQEKRERRRIRNETKYTWRY